MPEFVPQSEPTKAAPVSKPLEGGVSIPVSPQVIQRKELEGYIQRRKDEQMEKYFPGGIPAQVPPIPWGESPQAQAAAAMPTIQMKAAPATTATNSGKVIQKKDPDYPFVRMSVVITVRMTGEEFKVHALQSLFGGVMPEGGQWGETQKFYDPKNSPITVNVAASLIKGMRGKSSAAKGIDVNATGDVAGAKERATKFGSGPNTKDKADVMAEIDRRYYEAAKVTPGEKIKGTKGDKGEEGKAALWRQIQDEVLFQNDYIKNLPPAVKQLIKFSSDGKKLEAKDIEQMFRIAKKIEGMEAIEIMDYLSKITGTTTDLTDFESMIDKFVEAKKERKADKDQRETTQAKLFGLKALYKLYKDRFDSVEAGTAFEAALAQSKFANVAEFEKYIRDFKASFQKEAVNILLDILGQYEGTLYKESQRYKDPKVVATLFQQLGGFRKKYYQAGTVPQPVFTEEEKKGIEISRLPGNGGTRPQSVIDKEKKYGEDVAAAREAAKQEVVPLAEKNPLLIEDNIPLDQRLDKAKLYLAKTPDELGKLLQSHIADRIVAAGEARKELLGDQEKIYDLKEMMPTFYDRMNILKGDLCDELVTEVTSSRATAQMVKGILLAVLAIALVVATMGGASPWVVAGASAVGFGLSAYQAYDEYEKYVSDKRLAAVGFTKDPSMFWLVVSVLAAAVDLGTAANALSKLAKPVAALKLTGDFAVMREAVETMAKNGEIDAKIAASIEKSLASKKAFRQAADEFAQAVATKNFEELFPQLVNMAKAKLAEGITSFEQFVLEVQKARNAAKLAELTPEELVKVKEAWEQAKLWENSGKVPVDILKKGKRYATFSKGNSMEFVGKDVSLYGGNTLKLNPTKTTTITGTLDDVNQVAYGGQKMFGATMQGVNEGGVNILRSPKWMEIQAKHKALEALDPTKYWRTVSDEFWTTVNKPWLEEAIKRGDNLRFVSNPADQLAMFVTKKNSTEFVLDAAGNKIPSIFSREVDFLTQKGFKFLPDGTVVKP